MILFNISMRSKICIIILIIMSPISYGYFGYSKRDQHMWSAKHEYCAGKHQSPIAIPSDKWIACSLPALEMVGYHNILPRPLLLKNNGHSVTLNIQRGISKERLPYIFGAMLKPNQEYEMESLHFHWGSRNDRGSEHLLHGIRYPMEMHIIHRNMAYANLSFAMKHEDGLCVLGIFFQVQEEDNKQLSLLLDILRDIKWYNTEIHSNISVTLSSLMPQNTDIFYTYKGSLTTPPCNEVVTWIIFSVPVPISFRQMHTFRTVSNGERILVDNYRHLQVIGRRKIYVRKLNPFVMTKCYATALNVTNLSWFWQ